MNLWNIPSGLESEIRKRDRKCVYCGVLFSRDEKKTTATWEHIINDAKIITIDNIALCCFSCNASKGAKDLVKWLEGKYCISKNINAKTVSEVILKAINRR